MPHCVTASPDFHDVVAINCRAWHLRAPYLEHTLALLSSHWRFLPCLQAVFDFVDVQSGPNGETAPGSYHLATSYPRRVLEVRVWMAGGCLGWR